MREIMSGRRRGAGASLLRAALATVAGPYAGTMWLRRWMYRRALLPSRRAKVPVICIGNITTGGTGKTPMVAWVVGRLKAAGCNPAILTRGYRPAAGQSDEAELLKHLCDAPVVINGDRPAGAAQAVAGGADVLVMDDGFQHRRLRRDMDVVLIDATNPFGYGHCLPRGLLREGPSALRYPRESVPEPVQAQTPPFESGRANLLAAGEDLAVLAFGFPAYNALEARALLSEEGISAAVYDARFAKPVDVELLRALVEAGLPVITVEDHHLSGGFGTSVLETCAEQGLATEGIRRLALPDRWIYQGSRAEQQAEAGIDAAAIAAAARRASREAGRARSARPSSRKRPRLEAMS